MPRLLAVSPHLDDAVFSAGGTLFTHVRQGWKVMIVTCFTATMPDPQGFALACQLDKGLAADVDYMALRRAEDIAACAVIGVVSRHLPLPEAPHRGYKSAAALFGDRLVGDEIGLLLDAELRALINEFKPHNLIGPAGIGRHVDHLVILDALRRVRAETPLLLWEDWPYADRAGRLERRDENIRLDADAIAAKTEAALCYRSQLGFQFGGADALIARMEGIESEGFMVA